MSVLLDTHVWVWWLTSTSPLDPRERNALDALADQAALHLAAISLWEVQLLHAKRRLEFGVPLAEWLTRATDPRVLTVVPLDLDVVLALDALPARFHGDPADRMIVATARARRLVLATHDTRIRRARVVSLWAS